MSSKRLLPEVLSRRRLARTLLAPGVSHIRFEFVALSLRDSERNIYQVRLEGADNAWTDTRGRREISYVGLPPGRYRLQVRAANAEGVWNMRGDALALSIALFFWQTLWFRMLAVFLALLALGGLVRWRYRAATESNRQKADAKIAERERIARDLHDTLLQGFQGLMLRFQAIALRLPPDEPNRTDLERVLEQGDDIVTEARDRISALRHEVQPTDLRAVLHLAAERIVADRVEWTIVETLKRRPIHGGVVDETRLIVGEALFNVVRHSGARSLRIGIRYCDLELVVQVLDDGAGLPRAVQDAGGREGHYGLIGMRERASQLGGKVTIFNPSAGGCEVKLTVPVKIAYR